MLGCIFQIIFLPFEIFYLLLVFFAKIIFYIIASPFYLFGLLPRNRSTSITRNTKITNKVKNNTNKKNTKSDFDKEVELWNLSEEDKKIAKEERMSPAEYIEAEERDDDNLDTDD